MTADSGTSNVVPCSHNLVFPVGLHIVGITGCGIGHDKFPVHALLAVGKVPAVFVTSEISIIPDPFMWAPLTYSKIFTYFTSIVFELNTFVDDSWTRR